MPPVKVTTTCSGCLSPSGCHRLSESRREESYHPPGQIILMGLMSSAARLQHYVKISRSPCSILSFFSHSAQGLSEREAYKVETEACLFAMLWVSICLVRKKRKETVVLMLSEQLPTWMTKLCPKPFSPRLDSHEFCGNSSVAHIHTHMQKQCLQDKTQMQTTGFVNLQCNLRRE